MQTAFRTSQGWTGTADYSLSKFVPHPKGNLGTEKKDTSATGKHNAFLTGRITPLAPDYWHQDMDNDSPINLTTPENFDYLYRSASRYAELMGIKLPFRYRKGGCPRLNITELYRVMEECVPECINLEKKSGRLHFCLFRHHDWPEPALFWIPVDFTERLPAPLKDIVREFIRQFVRHHGLYDVTETFYYDFAIEELEDWGNRDSDASPKEIRANRRLADSYQSGKRMKALRRMSGKPFCKSLEEAVRNYRTKKEKELNGFWKEYLGIGRSPLKALKTNREMVYLSEKLATMKRDIDISCGIEDLKLRVDIEKLKEELGRYEMFSLIKEVENL